MEKETRYPGNFNPCIDEDLLIKSMQSTKVDKDEPPRSICLWKYTHIEKVISEGVNIIENMGAHPLLTEAQCLLMDAQRKIAKYIDEVLPTADDKRINPTILPYLEDIKIKGRPKTSLDVYFDRLLKTGSF